MKKRVLLFLALFLFFYACGRCQDRKPIKTTLDNVFTYTVGRTISLNVDTTTIVGYVIEKKESNPLMVTLTILSTNYNGMQLTLSKSIIDRSVMYSGILHGTDTQDVLVLLQSEGKYFFKRRKRS